MANNTMHTVYTVNNGGMPFVVKLTSTNGPGVAHVFRRREEDDNLTRKEMRDPSKHTLWLQPWRSIEYTNVLIGHDPHEKSKGFMKDWWCGGHSVLLQVTPCEHVFIGMSIFEFRTQADDAIVEFVSLMGNSAIPYPYAIGTNNVYLLIEDTFVPKTMLTGSKCDPYDWLYAMPTPKRDEFVAKHKLQGYKVLHNRMD